MKTKEMQMDDGGPVSGKSLVSAVPVMALETGFMTRLIKAALAICFLAGFLLTGLLGTETRLLFFWPGAALIGLAGVLAAVRWRWRVRNAPVEWCLATVLLLGVYFLVRQINSPVLSWAREDLFMMLGCGVAYFLAATVLSHPRWRMGMVALLAVLLVANLAVGFVHFSGHWGFHLVPHYMRTFGEGAQHRIGGLFINPNHLAAFLAMMAMLMLGLACFGRGGAVKRLLYSFAAIAAAIGITLTESRGAMIGLGAGVVALVVMILMVLRRAHPHLVMKAALGMVLAGGLASLVLGAVMKDRLQNRFADGDFFQGDPRLFIWRSALAQHAEHPWFGAGARMFYEGCVRLRPDDAPSWMRDAQFTHNEWLQALADYGWVGLALVILVFAVHLGNGWRYLSWFAKERFPRTAVLNGTRLGLTVGAMAAIVAALVHAVFEFHFHVPAVALFVAILLGVLANPGFERPLRRPRRIPGVRILSKMAMLGCGAALMWGAWMIGRADYFVERSIVRNGEEETKIERMRWLNLAVELDPANAQTWYERGQFQLSEAEGRPWKIGRVLLESAAYDLEQSHLHNPYDISPNLELADALDALGRYAEARIFIDEACRAAPLYYQPRLALAKHLNRLGKWSEAEESYLWASEAKAGIHANEWIDLYQEMLRNSQGRDTPP